MQVSKLKHYLLMVIKTLIAKIGRNLEEDWCNILETKFYVR